MPKKQLNMRASDLTIDQVTALTEKTGMTQTEILSTAIDRMYREEIKMKYTVTAKDRNMQVVAMSEVLGELSAKIEAETFAEQYPNCQIYVTWFRSSDGQQGYYNQDGNHAITGEAWTRAVKSRSNN